MRALLLWIGCTGAPQTTGPDGLVGQVVDATGEPVEGLDVSTLETTVATSAEGAFAIPWKPPNQLVHFRWRGLHYERRHQPADEGGAVTLRLPTTRQAQVTCPSEKCALELSWPLEGGLRALYRNGCEPDHTHELPGAPVDTPQVRCRAGSGNTARELPLQVADRGDSLLLVADAAVVRVELRTLDEAPLPEDCRVSIGGRVASSVGPGQWAAEMSTPGVVTATCAGRPAVPRQVDPAVDVGLVALEWSEAGPDLDLEAVAPWAEHIQVVAETGPDAGWVLQLAPGADGVIGLPPLGAGQYRLMVQGTSAGLALATPAPEPGPPGTVVLVRAGDESLVGTLVVTSDRLDGRLPVVGP